jgi:hypothetical protein
MLGALENIPSKALQDLRCLTSVSLLFSLSHLLRTEQWSSGGALSWTVTLTRLLLFNDIIDNLNLFYFITLPILVQVALSYSIFSEYLK